jgi:hypothetical protein
MVPFPMDSEDDIPGKHRIANHCFRLRQLQSEAADVLYQRSVPYYPGFIDHVQERIDVWLEQVPREYLDSVAEDWFDHAYHNLCMFVRRPSVVNPFPSSSDLQRCFESASAVLKLYQKMHRISSIESTWMAVHWLFLAGITQLFCIWTDEQIRNSIDWTIIYEETHSTGMVLAAMAERLVSAQKMPQVYLELCTGTFKKYGELYAQSDDEKIWSVFKEMYISF